MHVVCQEAARGARAGWDLRLTHWRTGAADAVSSHRQAAGASVPVVTDNLPRLPAQSGRGVITTRRRGTLITRLPGACGWHSSAIWVMPTATGWTEPTGRHRTTTRPPAADSTGNQLSAPLLSLTQWQPEPTMHGTLLSAFSGFIRTLRWRHQCLHRARPHDTSCPGERNSDKWTSRHQAPQWFSQCSDPFHPSVHPQPREAKRLKKPDTRSAQNRSRLGLPHHLDHSPCSISTLG